MKTLTISLAVSQMLLVLSCNAAPLAWKFTPGDEQNYRLTQSSRLTGGAHGEGNQLATVEQVLDLTWKVLEVDESGDAKVSLGVAAFSLLAKGPDGQEVHYDSESTEEPEGYAAMLAPIGKRLAETQFVFTMNSRGEISNVRVPDDLADAVKSVPGGKKFAQDGGLASVETMARLGSPFNLPEGEATANHKWTATRDIEIPVLGATAVEFTYKVVAPVSEDEVTIEQQMKMTPAADAQVANFTNQKSTGTIAWDVAAGRPETSLLNYEVEIEQPGSEDGPLKLEQSTEFRRIADDSQ
jgi:hypothetical protein